MKKIYLYIVLGVVSLMGIASCDKFLEVDYYDIIEPEALLTSQEYIERGLIGVYDELYYNNLSPNISLANHPMMDIRPTGWDYDFGIHAWRTDHSKILSPWVRSYDAINRANRFLINLRNADLQIFEEGEKTLKNIEAQARAIRAYYYTTLVQNYGGVPSLLEGETFITHPSKPRETAAEIWNIIITDLEYARGILDWEPWKGQNGRITLGMVKYYLAQAYMYNNRFEDAKRELKDIIDSGKYSLNPCFGQIHLEGQYWQNESVWEICYPVFDDMSRAATAKTDALWYPAQQFAPVEYGGWGPQMTSYEFIWSFEPGDKRLQYEVAQFGQIQPFINKYIGVAVGARSTFIGDDVLPNNHIMKWWKEIPNVGGKFYTGMPATVVRLAGVYLNYAECCFETEGADSQEGWDYIQKVRDRAWGALEPLSTYDKAFPFTLNTDPSVKAPDAKTYYASYKRIPGKVKGTFKRLSGDEKEPVFEDTGVYESSYEYTPYTSPIWKVALLIERRHELYGEFSLWYDACRTGMVKEHLDAEYPKNSEAFIYQDIPGFSVDKFIPNPHTIRTFEYDKNRELYPIPQDEMLKNPALSENQNPGY